MSGRNRAGRTARRNRRPGSTAARSSSARAAVDTANPRTVVTCSAHRNEGETREPREPGAPAEHEHVREPVFPPEEAHVRRRRPEAQHRTGEHASTPRGSSPPRGRTPRRCRGAAEAAGASRHERRTPSPCARGARRRRARRARAPPAADESRRWNLPSGSRIHRSLRMVGSVAAPGERNNARTTSLRTCAAGDRDPGLVGQDDRLDAVAQAELHQHAGDVGLDGGLGDDQLRGDLGVRQAAGDELEDLELAGGQLVEARAAAAGGGPALANSWIRRRVIEARAARRRRRRRGCRRRAARAGRP